MNKLPVLACAAIIAIAGVTTADAASTKRRHVETPRSPKASSVDTVGSIVYDSRGFAVNRRTGQRYYGCVIDDGYGRVSSCDSGVPN